MREPDDVVDTCRRVQPVVYGALLLYCGDRSMAEELTQETLARMWQHWPTVSAMDRPDHWALRVGFNLAKSAFRRRRVARAARQLLATAPAEPDPSSGIVVRAAVATLPPRQRSAVVLRYFGDLSVAETARVLGCAEGTVKALTSQAIDGLRRRLGAVSFTIADGADEHAARDA